MCHLYLPDSRIDHDFMWDEIFLDEHEVMVTGAALVLFMDIAREVEEAAFSVWQPF